MSIRVIAMVLEGTDGKHTISKEELEKIIHDAYQSGFEDGKKEKQLTSGYSQPNWGTGGTHSPSETTTYVSDSEGSGYTCFANNEVNNG